jgi:hypothetical protein
LIQKRLNDCGHVLGKPTDGKDLAVKILEEGKEAFTRRREKYGFS